VVFSSPQVPVILFFGNAQITMQMKKQCLVPNSECSRSQMELISSLEMHNSLPYSFYGHGIREKDGHTNKPAFFDSSAHSQELAQSHPLETKNTAMLGCRVMPQNRLPCHGLTPQKRRIQSLTYRTLNRASRYMLGVRHCSRTPKHLKAVAEWLRCCCSAGCCRGWPPGHQC
jgi:hypothetical protein